MNPGNLQKKWIWEICDLTDRLINWRSSQQIKATPTATSFIFQKLATNLSWELPNHEELGSKTVITRIHQPEMPILGVPTCFTSCFDPCSSQNYGSCDGPCGRTFATQSLRVQLARPWANKVALLADLKFMDYRSFSVWAKFAISKFYVELSFHR